MEKTIKEMVHSKMKPVIKNANRRKYKVIYADEIPFNCISGYRYYPTYEGRIVGDLLRSKGYTLEKVGRIRNEFKLKKNVHANTSIWVKFSTTKEQI